MATTKTTRKTRNAKPEGMSPLQEAAWAQVKIAKIECDAGDKIRAVMTALSPDAVGLLKQAQGGKVSGSGAEKLLNQAQQQ